MTYTSLRVDQSPVTSREWVRDLMPHLIDLPNRLTEHTRSGFSTSFSCPNIAYSTLSFYTGLRHTVHHLESLDFSNFCSVFTPVVQFIRVGRNNAKFAENHNIQTGRNTVSLLR